MCTELLERPFSGNILEGMFRLASNAFGTCTQCPHKRGFERKQEGFENCGGNLTVRRSKAEPAGEAIQFGALLLLRRLTLCGKLHTIGNGQHPVISTQAESCLVTSVSLCASAMPSFYP